MAKRSKLDIIIDILNCINEKGRIKPTHLMYRSNLSHIQMKRYVSELVEKDLIKKRAEKNKTLMVITEKGRSFLAEILRMKAFQETFGL
jgi:predicted transcriptional regulator